MSSAAAANTHSWEAHKENAAPLERGRNVSSLGRCQFGRERNDLKEKVRRYEDLVAPSEDLEAKEMDNDPLQHWLSYIKFYQNSFPSDTRENFLIIERCVRALVKMKQYRNDDRFVSVCAKYADKTKDPGQVFKYLHQQKVGAQTALFWIAWAFVAEKNSDFPFAEQIFKKGLSKNAEPQQMLKLRHQQFQRRMSRHWLNSSKASEHFNDEYESGEQSKPSRSTLGGVSRDGLRRNDRSQRRVQQGAIQNPLARRTNNGTSRTTGNNQDTNNVNKGGAFSIFVEEQGENAYNLDQDFSTNDRATIARDSDRRKENTLVAERWNERGGMTSSYQKANASTSRSTGPPPAFAVFVDDECAAEHERQVKEQEQQMDRQRQVRDERTFRERDREGMAEKLFRDPVRYMKDPNRIHSEKLKVNKEKEDTSAQKEKVERKSRAGFNKRLLKNKNGEEQSFEEARARANAYNLMVGSSNNFNLLLNAGKTDQSSQMDLDDEGGLMDLSMAQSAMGSVRRSTGKMYRKQQAELQTEGKRLFEHVNGSFEAGLNQTAISNASSTVNEIDIVGAGLHGKHEEETINTKFAMKELSMMFSSPAFGIDGDRKRLNRSRASKIDESVAYDGDGNVSFGNVGDGIMLDNSICNSGRDEESVKVGEKVKTGSNEGFAIFCDENTPVEDPGENKKTFGGGFQIYDDGEGHGTDHSINNKPSKNELSIGGFQIYNEADGDDINSKSKEKSAKNKQSGEFEIFVDDNEDSPERNVLEKPNGSYQPVGGFQIFDEGNDDNTNLDNGDTASISDAIALLADKIESDEESSVSSSEENDHTVGNGENTANISLINELFRDQSGYSGANDDTGKYSELCSEQTNLRGCSSSSLVRTANTANKRVKRSTYDMLNAGVDFQRYTDYCTTMNSKHLQSRSDVPDSRATLFSLVMSKNKVFHLPNAALPKQLRRKKLVSNTRVVVGRHAGMIVQKELGRGTFGRVILMNTIDPRCKNAVAIKVQSPTGSLGWEYTILQRLEQRLLREKEQAFDYSYPRPISFVSLLDGGMLSMSAASESGLNLVDLSNFYKLKVGQPVPELIAMHYTSIALRIIEQLHSYGKILHCDVKPDNFVLSTSTSPGAELFNINGSNLTLVDFGNAVDLTKNSDNTGEGTQNLLFRGYATKKDMQCVAMRNGNPWSYDVDTFGILCCAHVLLHGTHMQIKKGRGSAYQPLTSFKRYWNQDLWKEIFGTLLNVDEYSGIAFGSRAPSLRRLRRKIDAYLDGETQQLCHLLTRQANILPDTRENIR